MLVEMSIEMATEIGAVRASPIGFLNRLGAHIYGLELVELVGYYLVIIW